MADYRIGAKGNVWVAATSVAAPADHLVAMPTGWNNIGSLTDDAATLRLGKETWSERPWGSFYAGVRGVSSRSMGLSWTQMETFKKEAWLLAMDGGAFIQVASGTGVTAHSRYEPPEPETIAEKQVCLEWFPSATVKNRLIIPRGMLDGDVEISIQDTGSIKAPISFAANGDPGVKPFYILSNDPLWAAA